MTYIPSTMIFRKRVWVRIGDMEYLYDINLLKGYRRLVATREVHIPEFLINYI